MKAERKLKEDMQLLTLEELQDVSGGDTWSCTVQTNPTSTDVHCVNQQTGQRVSAIYYK